MRAKFVNENAEFKKGKDPRHSMGIGRGPTLEDLLNPVLEKELEKYSDTGKIEFDWQGETPGPVGPIAYADDFLVVTIPCSNKKKRNELIDLCGGTYMNPSNNNNLYYEIEGIAYEYNETYHVFMEPKAYGIPRKGVKLKIAFVEYF